MIRSALLVAAAISVLFLSGACVSVQDYGGAPGEGIEGDDAGAVDPSLGADAEATPVGPHQWEWLNPAPTGRTLFGIGGTSESDIWACGEAGTIAHFDGTRWDSRRSGPEGARYFAVGTRAKGDVWIAGEVDGRTEVVHFDGKDWLKSYPFAGAAFGGFSRGPGNRLFAFLSGQNDWDILELSPSGTWERTDTSDNDVFGPAVDIWVTASGDAWAMTKGAKLLRLPAGSKVWQLQTPVAGVATGSIGLGFAGAGTKMCAFYTGAAAGTGYLWYDGTWQVGPSDPEPLMLDTTRYGARVACLSDGSGIMAYGGDLVLASPTSAPVLKRPFDFKDERLFGAWSIDGAKAYAVGSLGAFMTRASGAMEWREKGPTVRNDLFSVDVGLDGTAMVASAFQPDRTAGGEVLFASNGALTPYSGGGISGPRIPVAVAVVDAKDAWVISNDVSVVGITHWTGRWSATWTLKADGIAAQGAQAIWAPAKDDVWATARKAVWHYEGASWKEVPTTATYRSIHGTGPNDVWFAGEGVAHWDGKALTPVASLKGAFAGVWSSAPGRVWLWGERAILFDGAKSTPVETALNASAEWDVSGIAESSTGDVFVLTKKSVGTELLWFDETHQKLVDIVSSDLELTAIRGRGERIAAVGAGGAFLQFVPSPLR